MEVFAIFAREIVQNRHRYMGKTSKLSDFSLDGIDFSVMREHSEVAFVNDFFAMMFNVGNVRDSFMASGRLYRFAEGRILLITSGWARLEINLEEYELVAGDIVMIVPDVIVEFKEASDDWDFIGMMFREEVAVPRLLHLKAMSDDWEQTIRMVRLLWDVSHHEPFRRAAVRSLIEAIVANINGMYTESCPRRTSDRLTRQEQLFSRFKKLVSRHCTTERNVAFYADSLCVSPHYLSAVVSRVSGETVMHWINHAVILQAKVMLRTDDMMIYEVADSLNFPSQSFFGRFFKRETGMTPGEYQRKNEGTFK